MSRQHRTSASGMGKVEIRTYHGTYELRERGRTFQVCAASLNWVWVLLLLWTRPGEQISWNQSQTLHRCLHVTSSQCVLHSVAPPAASGGTSIPFHSVYPLQDTTAANKQTNKKTHDHDGRSSGKVLRSPLELSTNCIQLQSQGIPGLFSDSSVTNCQK